MDSPVRIRNQRNIEHEETLIQPDFGHVKNVCPSFEAISVIESAIRTQGNMAAVG
jgi:hypothetical protein